MVSMDALGGSGEVREGRVRDDVRDMQQNMRMEYIRI